MKLLFLHRNLPGQFRELAPELARRPDIDVWTLGELRGGKRFPHPGITDYWYKPPEDAGEKTHPYVRNFEAGVRRGQTVYRALRAIREKGFEPDVVMAHPGWGETLFIKDLFPDSRVVCFWEFFYRSKGSDLGFDPEFGHGLDSVLKNRMMNATQLAAFESCDWGVSPTLWQKSLYPDFMQQRMEQLFEGVRTDVVRPDPEARFQVPGGPALSRSDEVLTYVARNLEPYRGFHTFVRALPEILRRRPNCRVLVVGEDGVSYGRRLPEGQTYKEMYLKEVGLKSDRVHFLGRLSYGEYLRVLQVSSLHLYMTYPFVLSWSCLEAMSAGGLVLGSDTPPVRDAITHGENGLLLEDMLDPKCVAERAVEALARRGEHEHLRAEARKTILDHFDFHTVGLPGYERMLREQAARR